MLPDIKRYPFILTDDIGNILLSSPENICSEKNFLSSNNISAEDLRLIEFAKRNGISGRKLALRYKRNGKLILLLTAAFPDTRSYILLFSDIEFKYAADLCKTHYKSLIISSDSNDKLSTKHERIFSRLGSLIDEADILFPANLVLSKYSCASALRERILHIAHIAGCQLKLTMDPLSDHAFMNLQHQVLGIFLLSVFTAASSYSDEREATVSISEERMRLRIKAEITLPRERKIHKKDYRQLQSRFDTAFRHIRSILSGKNLPGSIIVSDKIYAEISPNLPEVSFLGIKAYQAELTYGFISENKEQEKEQKG